MEIYRFAKKEEEEMKVGFCEFPFIHSLDRFLFLFCDILIIYSLEKVNGKGMIVIPIVAFCKNLNVIKCLSLSVNIVHK